jgi:DNA-binding transcriptional MerR regulator
MRAALSEKSPEAFRTISEVAEMLDVPQHVLRFWETRFAHVKPIKRAGGRRFYRPEDVDLLRGIRTLLYYDGYTIKGAQKVLREKGARFVVQLGRENGNGIEEEVEEVAADGEIESDRQDFNALATLARVHDDAAETLDGAHRARLAALLEELVALKSRLADARASASV